MFHSSLPRLLPASVVFLYSVFPCLSCVLLYSCIKKGALLSCCSASVSVSVCLCPSGHLPGCLAAGGKVRPLSGQAHRVDSWWVKFSPLTPRWPNRRGHAPLPLSPSTFCVCVPPCAINLFSSLLCCQVVISEVGEVFSFSLSFIFWFLFSAKRPFILLLACLWFFNVCMQKPHASYQHSPLPNYLCCHHHKSCTMNAQTIVSLQLCDIDDTLGSACNYISLNVLAYLACLHFWPIGQNKVILNWGLQPKRA